MRTRDLKPGFFRNEELAALHPYARLLFQGLWCIADKKGRLKDSPALIKADLFPYENVPVAKHLVTLAEHGFIQRYEVGNFRGIWLPTFQQHQHPHPKEPGSVLPQSPAEPLPDHGEAVAGPLPDHGEAVASTRNGNDPSASVLLTPPPSIPSIPSGSSVPSVPSEPSSVKPARDNPLNFTDAEWSELVTAFPLSNVQGLWHEWVKWIEEEERAGRSKKPRNNLRAFKGFVRGKTTAAAAS